MIKHFLGSSGNMNTVYSEPEISCLQVLIRGNLPFDIFFVNSLFHLYDGLWVLKRTAVEVCVTNWLTKWMHSQVSSLHLGELVKRTNE